MLNIFLLNFFTKTTMGICICLGLLISGLVLGISYMLAIETSSYKCGVELFDDARNRFDVRFYIVAILFLIFDVEVAFLFSDVLQLGLTGYVGYMACDKSRFTPNSFYVANTNPVIVLEILAPTVKN
jgi:NADH-quinone oxidoreductase subunit A